MQCHGNHRCEKRCLRFCLLLSPFYTFLSFFNFDIIFYYFFFTIFSYNKCRVIRVRFGLQSKIKSEITYDNCKTQLSSIYFEFDLSCVYV